MNRHLIFLFTLVSSSLFGAIIEIKQANEIAKHFKNEMLVIFDIDNTILEPVQELGRDQWFYHRIQHHTSLGTPSDKALQRALNEWTAVQYITSVNLIEDDMAKVIGRFQDKGIPVIGLTTRGSPLAHRTIEQLESIGVDLQASAPNKEEHYILQQKEVASGVVFKNGVLFTGGTHKGETLFKLLDKLSIKPKSILFINDKASHLAEVERTCQKLGVEFVGLRYGFLDEKVAAFNVQLADRQWDHFTSIPSDEAAAKQVSKG